MEASIFATLRREREAAQNAKAQASRAETQRRNPIAQHEWKNNGQSISEEMYDREFSLGSTRFQYRQLQVRSLSLGHMLRLFAEGDGARMHDIGMNSLDSRVY